ncbi:MAG: hypothetical protein KF752_19945 [Pirellulaceae bacterium]|nr:hypothetical protein [Pirellulaceae bacterium]
MNRTVLWRFRSALSRQSSSSRNNNRRRVRALLLETLEDRRVLSADLMLDQLLVGQALLNGSTISAEQYQVVENVPELRIWRNEAHSLIAANNQREPATKQAVGQLLEDHAETALARTLSAVGSTSESAQRPVSQGTRNVASAISQSIAGTNWQQYFQSDPVVSASQLNVAIADGQPPPDAPLLATPPKIDSSAISQALLAATSPTHLVGGQLMGPSASNKNLVQSMQNAESQMMTSGGGNQPSSGSFSIESQEEAVDYGLRVQTHSITGQQISQAVDGSLIASLFGQTFTQPSLQLDSATAWSPLSLAEEGEDGPNGSGTGGSVSNDPPAIPHVDFPQIRFAASGVDPGSFEPVGLVSFTNVRQDPITPTGFGSQWTHTVTVNWTSHDFWTYTETLSMTYFVSESTLDGGPLSELEPPPGDDPEDDPENDPGLSAQSPDNPWHTEGDWSSNVSTTRVGFVFMTFTAARGTTTATVNSPLFSNIGGGTRWTIALNYLDAVQTVASASATASMSTATAGGGSTSDDPGYTAGNGPPITAPGSGSGNATSDVTGSASWSAAYRATELVHASLNIANTPFLFQIGATPAQNIVDRLINASGFTQEARGFEQTESLSTSLSSGDLSRTVDPANPQAPPAPVIAPGGRTDIDYDETISQMNAAYDDMSMPSGTVGNNDAPVVPLSALGCQPYIEYLADYASSVIAGSAPSAVEACFVGAGFSLAASSSRSSSGTASVNGHWHVMGILREAQGQSHWLGAFGGSEDSANAQLDADGRDDGQLVIKPESQTEPNPAIGGTSQYKALWFKGIQALGNGQGNANQDSTSAITNGPDDAFACSAQRRWHRSAC